MAPRTTAEQNLRQVLLEAGVGVLEERGPAGLTVRAIAARAGVSVGLLYNYFTDRDDLLVALTLDRFRAQADAGRQLVDSAGTGTVRENLVAFGSGMVSAVTLELARLVLTRWELADRVRQALGAGAPGLDVVEQPSPPTCVPSRGSGGSAPRPTRTPPRFSSSPPGTGFCNPPARLTPQPGSPARSTPSSPDWPPPDTPSPASVEEQARSCGKRIGHQDGGQTPEVIGRRHGRHECRKRKDQRSASTC